MNFDIYVFRVLRSEGGYSNDPRDPGGETMWGITLRVARKNGYMGSMKFLPREMAVSFYETEYWLPIRGDDLPLAIASPLFDAAVNSGPEQAIKFLQRALGVVPDGVFGPVTLAAALAKSPAKVAIESILSRHAFQASLPTWPAFGKGWSTRNLQNARELLDDLGLL